MYDLFFKRLLATSVLVITFGILDFSVAHASEISTCDDVKGDVLNLFNDKKRAYGSSVVGLSVIDTAQILENSKIRLCEASVELSNNTTQIIAYLIEVRGFSSYIRPLDYKNVEKEYNVNVGDALEKKDAARKAAEKPPAKPPVEKQAAADDDVVYADDDMDVTQPFTTCWRWVEPMAEKRQCILDEAATADKSLNEEYQKLMKSLPENSKRNLRERQRDWIKARDTKCGVDKIGQNPTEAELEKSAETVMCVGTTTAMRVEELRMMRKK